MWKWGNPLDIDFKEKNKVQMLTHPYSWTPIGYDNENNFKTLLNEKDAELRDSMTSECNSFINFNK